MLAFYLIFSLVLFSLLRLPIEREFKMIVLLACLYPLGKAVQFYLDIPSWIRWYVADVGWVPLWTLVVAISYFAIRDIRHLQIVLKDLLKWALHGLFWSLNVAIFVELFLLHIKNSSPVWNKSDKITVAGDIVDCVIYIVSSIVVLRLLKAGFNKAKSNSWY